MKYFIVFTIFFLAPLKTHLEVESVKRFSNKDIAYYRDRVVKMFYHAYEGYLKNAYPLDELRPITCDGHDTWGSYSLTLVDALDTLAVMGNYTEFRRVADIVTHSMDFDRDINVSVFETNIRIVGGLLSAHLMSRRAGMTLDPGWPCSGPLLNIAEKVARKLLPAFETSTGMPYGTVNLKHGVPKGETPVTCTAGVGTFIVEFGALSKLTGDPIFQKVALKALDALWKSRSEINLVGNHIDVTRGTWTAHDAGIGAGVDSYFEYLIKGSIMFQIPELMNMFQEYFASIEKYLKREDWYMWGNMQKGTVTLPVFQSLEAFWPGALSMIGEIDKAMKTIHNYHQVWQQFGFTPEFYNIPKAEVTSGREGYPLRPELAESAMYLYRATEDPYLLQIGVDIIEAIDREARTMCGYATVRDVRDHKLDNRMESFFLAETTKYLYLLFSPHHWLHNTGNTGTVINTPHGECIIETGSYIFNTEAHPIDTAALYCCSAEKAHHDMQLQQIHNDMDLLHLLGLADPKASANKPHYYKTPNIVSNSVSDKERPLRSRDSDKTPDSDDSQETDDQDYYTINEDGINHVLPKVLSPDDNSDQDSDPSHDEEDIEDKNSPFGYRTVHSAESVIIGVDGEKTIVVKETSDVDLDDKYITEKLEDEQVCEAKEVFVYDTLYRTSNSTHTRYSYPGHLFTCPAQPFHMRFSLMGEMFMDNTVN